MKRIPIEIWIQWVGATLVAAVTLTAFAYSEFETKSDSERAKDSVEKRLDRIEDKLDRLIENAHIQYTDQPSR